MNKTVKISPIDLSRQKVIKDYGSSISLDDGSITIVFDFDSIDTDEDLGVDVERTHKYQWRYKKEHLAGIERSFTTEGRWKIELVCAAVSGICVYFNSDEEKKSTLLYNLLSEWLFG